MVHCTFIFAPETNKEKEDGRCIFYVYVSNGRRLSG